MVKNIKVDMDASRTRRHKVSSEEGAAFNRKNQDLSEDDIEEVTGKVNIQIARERRKQLIRETKEREKIEAMLN